MDVFVVNTDSFCLEGLNQRSFVWFSKQCSSFERRSQIIQQVREHKTIWSVIDNITIGLLNKLLGAQHKWIHEKSLWDKVFVLLSLEQDVELWMFLQSCSALILLPAFEGKAWQQTQSPAFLDSLWFYLTSPSRDFKSFLKQVTSLYFCHHQHKSCQIFRTSRSIL